MVTKAEALAELARRGVQVRPKRQLSAQERKTFEEVQEGARVALETLPDVNRFEQLNAQTGTGGLFGTAPIAAVRNMFDPNVQQINEINARLTPAQRQPGSGTTSDRDLALFQQAVPGIGRDRVANTAILERGREEAVRRQQRADFYAKYAEENGTLAGAEQAFRGIVGLGSQDSPYDLSQGQSRATLPRAAYYRDPQGNVRRNDNADRGNPITTRATGRQRSAPQGNERQMQVYSQLGGNGVRGSQTNPIIINERDARSSYANVPPGAYFVTPDGQIKQKGR